MSKKLSFVIPCYGSQDTIESVIDEINTVVALRDNFTYEIICVHDCSPDDVLSKLKSIAEKQDNVTVIDLAHNSGKHAAVLAGYSFADGDYIVNLDDDGQCPMDRLWDLVDELEKGFDYVLAKYTIRKQSFFKNIGSSVNSYMSRLLLNKPKSLRFDNFSVVRRFIVDEIIKYKNPYPYLEGLYLRTSQNASTIKMEERGRIAGKAGFTFGKSFALWLNGFTAFSVIPLRLASVLGGLMSVFGFIFAIVLIVRQFLLSISVAGYASTMVTILFFNGITLMMIGLLGEYIGRMYISINNSPQYVIRDVIKKKD